MKKIFTRLMALCLLMGAVFVVNAQSTQLSMSYNSYGDGDNGSGTISANWWFASSDMFNASVTSVTDRESLVGQEFALIISGENSPITGWINVAIVDTSAAANWWTENSNFTGFWVTEGEPFYNEVFMVLDTVTETPCVFLSYSFGSYEDAQAFNGGVAMSENLNDVKTIDFDISTIDFVMIEPYVPVPFQLTITNDEKLGTILNYESSQTVLPTGTSYVCIYPKVGKSVSSVVINGAGFTSWDWIWLPLSEILERDPNWLDHQSDKFSSVWNSLSDEEKNRCVFIDVEPFESGIDRNVEVYYTDAMFDISIIEGATDEGYVTPSGPYLHPTYGEDCTLSITPRYGYKIKNIIVDGVEMAPVESYTFYNVTQNHTFQAVFATAGYSISTEATGNGTITPEAAEVEHGSEATFTFTPDEGYMVKSVKIDGSQIATSGNSYTFHSVASNHSLEVVFGLQIYYIDLNMVNATLTAGDKVEIELGESITYSFVPNEGCTLKDVLVDGESVGAVTSYTFDNVNADHSLEVVCEKSKLTITSDFGENGFGIGETMEVEYGDDVMLIFQPNVGYDVDKIYIDGVPVYMVYNEETAPLFDYEKLPEDFLNTMQSLEKEEYAYTRYVLLGNVKENHSVSVTYKPRQVIIHVSHEGEGTITPSIYGEMFVEYGSDQQFTITPAEGYTVGSVFVMTWTDEEEVDSIETYTFKNVTEQQGIYVEFIPASYNVTVAVNGQGTASPMEASLEFGSTQMFTFTPEEGYEVAYVLVNGKNVGNATIYDLVCPAQDTKVEVFFDEPGFTFVETVTGNGTITPDVARVLPGASQEFTFAANEGSYLVDVIINGESKGAIESYSFTDVQEVNYVEAVFAKDSFAITANANEFGTVVPLNVPVAYGDSQILAFLPKYGYVLNSVTANGSAVAEESLYGYEDLVLHAIVTEYEFASWINANSEFFYDSETNALYDQELARFYVVRDVKKDYTFEAIFGVEQYKLTVAPVENGSISPATIKVDAGASQEFTITADKGYEIEDVMVDGKSVGAVESYTFENVAEAHSISATFKMVTLAIDTIAESVAVYAKDYSIVVMNASGVVNVYDVTGHKIARVAAESDMVEIPVKAMGVYFVMVDNQSFSVIVK